MAEATNVNLLSTTCGAIDANASAIVGNAVAICDQAGADGNPCVTFLGATNGGLQ